MPKKRPARQHSGGQTQRPQPKKKDVMLVRGGAVAGVTEPVEDEEEEQTTTAAIKTEGAKTKTSSGSSKLTTKPASTTARRPETTTKPGAQLSRNLAAAQRAGRPGQHGSLRAGNRLPVGRQANLVSAEHYRYVLKELRLIAILAAVMFSVIIALTFVIPHFFPQ